MPECGNAGLRGCGLRHGVCHPERAQRVEGSARLPARPLQQIDAEGAEDGRAHGEPPWFKRGSSGSDSLKNATRRERFSRSLTRLLWMGWGEIAPPARSDPAASASSV